MTANEILLAFTEYSKGNSIEVPTRIVLRKREYGYVTRFQRLDNGCEFWGHYTDSFDKAKEDFEDRIRLNNEDYPPESPSHIGQITWIKKKDETA